MSKQPRRNEEAASAAINLVNEIISISWRLAGESSAAMAMWRNEMTQCNHRLNEMAESWLKAAEMQPAGESYQ
jgi:hypothetical protein